MTSIWIQINIGGITSLALAGSLDFRAAGGPEELWLDGEYIGRKGNLFSNLLAKEGHDRLSLVHATSIVDLPAKARVVDDRDWRGIQLSRYPGDNG